MSVVRKTGLTMLAGAAGAAAAYIFDPQLGRTRRARARDQVLSRFRHGGGQLERTARYAGSTASGMVKRAASAAKPAEPPANEVALVRKVESVIFRPEDAPKGRVSVNAENGVIFLRGEVETQGQIDMLVASAEKVDGVKAVKNLMHLPGEPAPARIDDDPLTRLESETIAKS